jgi:hypothetical protein
MPTIIKANHKEVFSPSGFRIEATANLGGVEIRLSDALLRGDSALKIQNSQKPLPNRSGLFWYFSTGTPSWKTN